MAGCSGDGCFGSYSDFGLVAQEVSLWFLFFKHEDEYLRHVAALECCGFDINSLS
jgi:hypothetical protein